MVYPIIMANFINLIFLNILLFLFHLSNILYQIQEKIFLYHNRLNFLLLLFSMHYLHKEEQAQ